MSEGGETLVYELYISVINVSNKPLIESCQHQWDIIELFWECSRSLTIYKCWHFCLSAINCYANGMVYEEGSGMMSSIIPCLMFICEAGQMNQYPTGN